MDLIRPSVLWFSFLNLLVINLLLSKSASAWLLIRRGQNGDLSYYLNNLNAISSDLLKSQDPREDCVFYVNSYNSTREKNAAIAFAEIRNRQSGSAGGQQDANTLYDAFDLPVAFGDVGTLMRQAQAAGPVVQRTYFKVTSGEYAKHCTGTVWLIVKKGSEIYEDAIWLTHEYPQLVRPNSGVTAIYEVDPADVEWGELIFNQTGDPNLNFRPSLYRGGQPPGATPPRDLGNFTYSVRDVATVQSKLDEYDKYPDVSDGYLPQGGKPSPQCDMQQISGVPFNVFTGVYSQFCEATLNNPLNQLAQIVDSHGFVKPPRRQRSLDKRTPPPNPDTYFAYTFQLQWTGGKGFCSTSCNEAFDIAANSPCGHTAGEQNIMSSEGTIDAGCGTYSWKIDRPPGSDPPPAPTVSSLRCNAADGFGNHGDIDPNRQANYVGFACAGSAGRTIKPGDQPITFRTVTNGTPYSYAISWISDCKSSVSEMNVYQPLPGDSENTCLTLLRRVYKDCNNGGVGGSIDVGCVRYEFHP